MPDQLTPLARISAAIEKLERLRDGAPSGPWSSLGTGRAHGDHWHVIADDESIAYIASQDGENEAERQPTADLIVTIHRTIDAQLGILRYTQLLCELAQTEPGREDLALADAILGGES